MTGLAVEEIGRASFNLWLPWQGSSSHVIFKRNEGRWYRWSDCRGLQQDQVEDGSEIASFLVYKGSSEQYLAFCSSEAVKAIDQYLQHRTRDGEKLTARSPLFRDTYDDEMSKETKIRSVDKVTSMNELSITVFLRRKWVECGVRNKENENGFKKRREFQSTHGFRKFFKSKMTNAGLGVLHVEALLGHLSGLQGAYFETDTNRTPTDVSQGNGLFVCRWGSHDQVRGRWNFRETKDANL